MFKKRLYKSNTPYKKGYKSNSSNSWRKKQSPSKTLSRNWSKTKKPSTFKWKPQPYKKQYSKKHIKG